jgi:aminoglycoside 3-N-acetyltransferase
MRTIEQTRLSGETTAMQRAAGGHLITRARVLSGLAALGVQSGDRLLVHASLSSLGFVAGGAQAVVDALKAAVGPAGLLVMPAFTSDLSDPANWQAPPVPADWWSAIRSQTPAFDPAISPSRGIGAVSELLRTSPDTVRGPHPHVSFAGWGVEAANIITPHTIAAWLGEGSPLKRLYDLDAKVLFLGTRYATCTAFHLGEHRAGAVRFRSDGAPMMIEGVRTWVAFEAPDYDTEAFDDIGAEFEARSGVRVVKIGAADCRLFQIRAAVDFVEARLRVASSIPMSWQR